MISVIIPVYNTASYLERCIKSVLNQSYTNFELILVDDGSTDGSGDICDKYKNKDNRIKVLHQQNGGASNARLNGFRESKGEWITFVDSDDTLPEDALIHYSKHFDDDTDIIIGWLNDFQYKEEFLSIDEYRRRNIGRCGIVVGPPTHTYRRNVLTPFVFDIPREIVMGEDMLMNIRIAFNTERPVTVTHHFVYNYNVGENRNNTTNNFKTNMEYEHRYHQLRLKSVPVRYHQMYMKEMVGIRVYELLRYIDASPFGRSWRHSVFFHELLADMDAINYKTNSANMMLLSTKSRLMQYLLITYKKLRCYVVQ